MSADVCRTETRGLRDRWPWSRSMVLVVFFFVLVGARTAFSQPGANATPTVVRLVIDSRTYSPADLPAKYSEYVRIATPEERVSDGVP